MKSCYNHIKCKFHLQLKFAINLQQQSCQQIIANVYCVVLHLALGNRIFVEIQSSVDVCHYLSVRVVYPHTRKVREFSLRCRKGCIMMDNVEIKLLPCKEWKSFRTLSPKTNSITLQLFMLSRIQKSFAGIKREQFLINIIQNT